MQIKTTVKYYFTHPLLSFSRQVMSNSLWPHGLQHTRLLCPSPSGVCPSWWPLNRWCHPTVSSPVALSSFCLRSLPASGAFSVSQLFASDDQNTGATALASFLPKKSQGWSPSEWTLIPRRILLTDKCPFIQICILPIPLSPWPQNVLLSQILPITYFLSPLRFLHGIIHLFPLMNMFLFGLIAVSQRSCSWGKHLFSAKHSWEMGTLALNLRQWSNSLCSNGSEESCN